MAKKKYPVKVDKKFLLDLANEIYDTKTRRFLRLCDGTLQNGPDPTDEDRPMHCGLGELYFAMTGLQPNEGNRHGQPRKEQYGGGLEARVSESEVVELALRQSTLPDEDDEAARVKAETAKAIQKLTGLSKDVKYQLTNAVDDLDVDTSKIEEVRTEFKDILDEIPSANDDACGDSYYNVFRSRSQRVAAQLRKAAKLLPA